MAKKKTSARGPAGSRVGKTTARVDRETVSQNKSDSTKVHGLAGPNARLRPGRATGQTFGVSTRTQSVGRPGATSDMERARNERRLPAANAHPRAAATSVSQSPAARKREVEQRAKTNIPVYATQLGYYDHLRRRPGDAFYIHAEEDFSENWMERAPQGTKPSITLGQDAINQEHDRILGERAGSRARKRSTRNMDVAGNVNTAEDARTLSEAQRLQQGLQRGRDDVNEEEIRDTGDNPLGADDE